MLFALFGLCLFMLNNYDFNLFIVYCLLSYIIYVYTYILKYISFELLLFVLSRFIDPTLRSRFFFLVVMPPHS